MSDRHPLRYNEFDIEAARAAGRKSEQSRIIKLLEEIKVINADQKFFVVQAIKEEQE